MRRFVGLVLTLALGLASGFSVARADLLHQVMRGFAQQSDLRAVYDQRTFGIVPADLQVNHAIALPSYIHGLAFVAPLVVPTLRSPGLIVSSLPALPAVTLAYDRIFTIDDATDRYGTVAVTDPVQSRAVPSSTLPRLSQLSPLLGATPTVALNALPWLAPSSLEFDNDAAQQAAFNARLKDSAIAISAPIHLGAFTVAGAESSQDYTALAAHDAQLSAGTVVGLRAGKHLFDLSVGSDYERLTDANAVTFTQSTPTDLVGYEATSALAQLPGGNPAMLIPNYADVTSRGMNAGLAMPVTGRLTVGVGYGTQRFTGEYGTSFVPNLDASNYSYLGNITFSLPRSSSAITLSARQSRYQDNLTPFSLQQTRADLNFTVKF